MLNGWKEIAAYIRREERTAMRWAAERGLPVHRAPGQGRGTVYALPSEIDDWLAADRERTAKATNAALSPPTIDREVIAPIITISSAARWRRRGWRVTALIGGGFALAVAGALTLYRPIPTVASVAYRGSSSDPIARDLYLRGRAAWSRRTPASLADATRLFGEAVARDPRMADAYVGLADAWLLRREFASVPQAEAYTRADAATNAALAIDPALPGAIRARGFIDFWWRRDERKGVAELRRAVALAPNDAQSHHWLATATGAAGNTQEAMREIDTARALDPANPAILADRASGLMALGHLAEAAAAYREILAAYPEQSDARAGLATLLLKMGDAAGFARAWQTAAALRGDTADAALYGEAADAFAPGAAPGARQAIAHRAEAACRAGWFPAAEAAVLVSVAGDHAGAKAILRSRIAQQDSATLIPPQVAL